jgi:nitric oxide reductase activation protein
MEEGSVEFYEKTLKNYFGLAAQIKKQFELISPETFRRIKKLPDGEEFELDAVIQAVLEKKAGQTPSEKLYWRRNKVERDVAVAFLLDMSASTAEAIDEGKREEWDIDDPMRYMNLLRVQQGLGWSRRNYKRIIDVEKEGIVLLIRALETIGDTYGIYGFSGYGRDNVEFYVIKDIEEQFSDRIKRRVDKISPMHATRMGPAIRHATSKLEAQDARTRILFLISDGRPQDHGYSRDGVEKEYAIHDTKMALTEAKRKNIVPFCLTVDRAGHDYLKVMCQDMGYEVLAEVEALPKRLPTLYKRLTL